jgi:EmrB/QacA subfamily drug resistance transporter
MNRNSTIAKESSAREGNWVLAAAILASSMAFIDGSALNVALPALQADLNASGADLLWIINAYLLMLAALILVGGSLGDQVGRKKVFMAGITLFVLASLACGLAPSTQWLIGARIVQGIGGALMIPGSLAIIGAYFGPEQRGRAIGTWSASTTIVTVAGPVLGGILADAGLWRAVFLINLPLGALALAVLIAKVPESRDESASGKLDLPGAILATLGLAGLTYGFISAPEAGFRSPTVLAALLGGILALAAFVLVEARSPNPMMPLHLFRSRNFSGANLLTLFLYGALSAAVLFLSLNLVQSQGYSQSLAGFAFTPFALLLTALSRWAGGLVDRYGPRRPLIAGPAVAGLGFLLMGLNGLTGGPQEYWWTFFPGIAVFGIGMGVTVAPLTTTVMGSVPSRYSGTASGINNAVSRTAGVLAIAILGAVALSTFRSALDRRSEDLGLAGPERQALLEQSGQLGNTPVPESAGPQLAEAMQRAIRLAFVDTFRLVLWLCAALAWISAAMAALLIRDQMDP